MTRLEKIIFYLFIFFLPFQTRKILFQWGDSFSEWTSIYLYLTDLLLIFLFLLWFWRKKKERFFKGGILPFKNKGIIKTPAFWLVVFLIVSLFSLIQARNIQLGFYHWFKLLKLAGLFFYLKYNFRQLFRFDWLAQVLVASGFFQSIIAWGQFINQKSLGLWLLRESPLNSTLTGIAKIDLAGFEIIRPYGGLPHPNLLAAFLFLSIFFLYFIWLRKKHTSVINCLITFALGWLIFCLGLTFSRVIIAVFVLASLTYFIFVFREAKKKKDKELFRRLVFVSILFFVFCSLFVVLAWPEVSSRFSLSIKEQAVVLRSFYNQTALSIIKEHPFLGIGLGNFVWEIRQMLHLLAGWLHQPVHNLYLLIAAETGLIGLVLFLMFIFQLLKRFIKQRTPRQNKFDAGQAMNSEHYYLLLFVVFCSLLIGLSDHFLWSLQQGQLIFWLILGLIASFNVGRLSTV